MNDDLWTDRVRDTFGRAGVRNAVKYLPVENAATGLTQVKIWYGQPQSDDYPATLGELLRAHAPEAAKMLSCVHGRPWNENCNDCADEGYLAFEQWFDTHWLAAKMAEPTTIYDVGPKVWPNLGTVTPGSIPNPYTDMSQKPEPTEQQKAIWRAVEAMSRG